MISLVVIVYVTFFICVMVAVVASMTKLLTTTTAKPSPTGASVQQSCSVDDCLSIGSTPSGDSCTVSCRSSEWETLSDGRAVCVKKDMSGPNLCTTSYPVQGRCSWENSLQVRALCSVGTILGNAT